MQDRNNKYKLAIEEAYRTLGGAYRELKERYKDYPLYLMEYIEEDDFEKIIEVRFDKQQTTISMTFNEENICDTSFLLFDSLEDEDCFVEYLNQNRKYDFKLSHWVMEDCYVKVKPPLKFGTAFCFYRE